MSNNLTMDVATRTLALLDQRKARLYSDRKCFYVMPLEGRVMVVFDPNHVDTGKINDDFAHRLSTRLQGRMVVRTNSRGIFLQVANEIPKALTDLTNIPLDLSRQPTPCHIPIGTTERGEMWINLLEGDSFLVAGSRGMGKTGELHGWIQALLHGGAVDVYGYDGKKGVEFARYVGRERFTLVSNLGTTLAKLGEIALERRQTLLKSGFPNIAEYNAAHPADPITPIALFVDEAALTTEEEKAGLVRIVERERDTGFYPILGTNRPQQEALLVKTNLVTRVCFAVPSWNASQMVLGMNGAEELPKIQGRGLIVFRARVTEFQSLTVTYPKPNEEALLEISEASKEDDAEPSQSILTAADEVVMLAEKIREQWSPSLRQADVARLLGFPQTGGSYGIKSKAVMAYLKKTTTTTTGENGLEMPVLGLVGS